MKKLQNKNLVHLTLMNCCINEESYHPDHYAKYTDHLPYNIDEWSIVYPKSISMRIPKQFVTRSIPYERPCGRRHQNGSKRCSATELRCSEDIGKRKWYVPCLVLKAKVKRLLRKSPSWVRQTRPASGIYRNIAEWSAIVLQLLPLSFQNSLQARLPPWSACSCLQVTLIPPTCHNTTWSRVCCIAFR